MAVLAEDLVKVSIGKALGILEQRLGTLEALNNDSLTNKTDITMKWPGSSIFTPGVEWMAQHPGAKLSSVLDLDYIDRCFGDLTP